MSGGGTRGYTLPIVSSTLAKPYFIPHSLPLCRNNSYKTFYLIFGGMEVSTGRDTLIDSRLDRKSMIHMVLFLSIGKAILSNFHSNSIIAPFFSFPYSIHCCSRVIDCEVEYEDLGG